MELLDKIYIPDTTFCLKMPNKYKILYDYLITDSNNIRSKTQFVNLLWHNCYNHISLIEGGDGDHVFERIISLVSDSKDFYCEVEGKGEEYVTSICITKHHISFEIEIDYTAKKLNIPNSVIDFYMNNSNDLLDNKICFDNSKYNVRSITIYGPQNNEYLFDLEDTEYRVSILICS
jgi:hypothetical protein